MEHEQSSHNINNRPPTQSMPMNFYGNNNNNNIVGQDLSDQLDRKPQLIMEANPMELGKTHWNNLSGSIQSPWWVQQQQHVVPQEPSSNQNYVQYLSENSVLESLPLLPSGISYDIPGLSDFNPDWHFNHYLGQSCGSTSNQLDNAWTVQTNEDLELQAQNHNPWMLNLNGESSYSSVSQFETPSKQVASVGSQTKPRSRASIAKPKVNDRERRVRINEKLTALQKLLPNSGEGCQASILDDVIDHVKYLQLQIKDLCKIKTESQSESTTVPIIFREGYGHYILDQQVLNEPLEEMLGKLLELNPIEAAQLLQAKGLLLMPIEFAQRFS